MGGNCDSTEWRQRQTRCKTSRLSLLKVTRLELELDLDSSRPEKERRVKGLKHCK